MLQTNPDRAILTSKFDMLRDMARWNTSCPSHIDMNRRNLISPAIIKHISRIASRGDVEFANAFLKSQNLPTYINFAIKKDIESTSQKLHKTSRVKQVPFSGAIRVYTPKENYVSSPRRLRNSISRS